MSVTIYTRKTCAPCKTLKYYLKTKGIEFLEKDADENSGEFLEHTSVPMVPLILLPGGEKIQGLNLPRLSEVLQGGAAVSSVAS